MAGFVYLLLANGRVCLPFVTQYQGLFTSSLAYGLYMSKGLIEKKGRPVVEHTHKGLMISVQISFVINDLMKVCRATFRLFL